MRIRRICWQGKSYMIQPILSINYDSTYRRKIFVANTINDSTHCFRVSVSALIFEDERILLAHRRDIDWWNLPGGAINPGETVDEALRREVYEETGLEVETGQL